MAGTITKTIQNKSVVTTPAASTATEFIDTSSDALGLPAVKRSDGSVVSPVFGTRNVNTTVPLTGGGSLAADLILAINPATTSAAGSMSLADKKRMAQVFDAVADFGFVGDLITTNATSSISLGTPTTLTDSSNPFTVNDIGKRITIPRAGAGASPNITQLTTTITGFNSAGSVTIGAAATNAVTNVSVSYGTDNTTAITTMQNTVNNATFPGARIIFGESATNAYGFPTTVVFNKQVQIEGIGGGHTVDSGDYTRIGGTRLVWWGTSSDGGTAFTAFFTISPTGVQSLKHSAFSRCWIDCRNNDQNQALFGLQVASCHGFRTDDFFIMDALAVGIKFDIATSPSGDAADMTRWLMTDFCSRQLDNPPVAMTTPVLMTSAVVLTTTGQSLTVAANTLPTSGYVWTETTAGFPVLVNYTGGGGTTTLTGCAIASQAVIHTPTTVNGGNVVQAVPGNGCNMRLDGGSIANTCCFTVLQAQLSHGTTWGPAAIETQNADSGELISVYINGGNATNDGAINRVRKPGVRINGSIVSATLASRNMSFKGGSAGVGGISCMGLLNTGAQMAFPSGPTYWDYYQLGNGETIPVREAATLSTTQAPVGGSLVWTPNGGLLPGVAGSTAIATGTVAAAATGFVPGTLVAVPPQGLQLGTSLRWNIWHSKTAAGVAARTYIIKYGATGTSADTSIATLSVTPSSVATADSGKLIIDFVITALGTGTSGAAIAQTTLLHNAAPSATAGGLTASLAPTPLAAMTMTGFNTTAPASGPTFFTVWITTGASEVISILPGTNVECISAGNP